MIDATYEVADYPNDHSTERTLEIVVFHRRLTLAWHGPLSRNARRAKTRAEAEFREKHAHLYEDVDGPW